MAFFVKSDIPPDLLGFFEPAHTEKGSVFNVNPKPYKGAHFACWPPALVEPMVLAGSSEKGCCPACGAPWERVVEKGDLQGEARIQKGVRPHADHKGMSSSSLLRTNGRTWRETTTQGWQPTCDCTPGGHEPVRCVVLDPFSGSATTGAVAMGLGRDYIGLDLNEKYLKLAEARLLGQKPPADTESGSDPDTIFTLFG